MVFPSESQQEDIRKQALLALTAQFIQQGHPAEYAQHMATATIFQADLELRNAQFTRVLSWLKGNHPGIYEEIVSLAESVRQEFEQRVQAKS